MSEENGTVEVCAMLADGTLGRTLVVTLTTNEGTATGWFFVLLFIIRSSEVTPKHFSCRLYRARARCRYQVN